MTLQVGTSNCSSLGDSDLRLQWVFQLQVEVCRDNLVNLKVQCIKRPGTRSTSTLLKFRLVVLVRSSNLTLELTDGLRLSGAAAAGGPRAGGAAAGAGGTATAGRGFQVGVQCHWHWQW